VILAPLNAQNLEVTHFIYVFYDESAGVVHHCVLLTKRPDSSTQMW
jgi:hypothetical protein